MRLVRAAPQRRACEAGAHQHRRHEQEERRTRTATAPRSGHEPLFERRPRRRAEERVVDVIQRQHHRLPGCSPIQRQASVVLARAVGHRERHARVLLVVAEQGAGAAEPEDVRALGAPFDVGDAAVVAEQEVGRPPCCPVTQKRPRWRACRRAPARRAAAPPRPRPPGAAQQPRLQPRRASARLGRRVGRAEQQARRRRRRRTRSRRAAPTDFNAAAIDSAKPAAAASAERRRAALDPAGSEQAGERERQPEDEVDLREKQRAVLDEREVEAREHDGEQPGAAPVRGRAQQADGERHQAADHQLKPTARASRSPPPSSGTRGTPSSRAGGSRPTGSAGMCARDPARQPDVEAHVRIDEVVGALHAERVDQRARRPRRRTPAAPRAEGCRRFRRRAPVEVTRGKSIGFRTRKPCRPCGAAPVGPRRGPA